jgi:hypothetical protein
VAVLYLSTSSIGVSGCYCPAVSKSRADDWRGRESASLPDAERGHHRASSFEMNADTGDYRRRGPLSTVGARRINLFREALDTVGHTKASVTSRRADR